jgi:uncharacterized protein YbjT (DUF2867 family)
MHIVVAGGTGVEGRFVVEQASEAGHEVTVVSRTKGTDLMTGAGLDPAIRPGSVVIDVSKVVTISAKKAVHFHETATRHLLAAEQRAGAAHHIALSIVGIDRVPLGYYKGKLRQEEVISTGGVPWTVLRATQFHEFPAQVVASLSGPIVPVPRVLSRTVAAREVAEELLRLAAGDPVGRAADFGGPETAYLPDLVRRFLRSRGSHRAVLPVPVPGPRDGLLPTADGPRGRQTFEEWLAKSGTLET